jgi:hypothetical protein
MRFGADYDRPAAPLRDAIIGRVEYASLDAEPKIGFSCSSEFAVLSRSQEFRHVFHDERSCPALPKCAEILAPECSSLRPDSVTIQRREALTRRSTDYDVGRGESLYVLDPVDTRVGFSEIRSVGRCRFAIHLNGKNRHEAPGVDESARKAAAAGE